MERFFGRFDHSLDAKGRLVLPARLRKSFEDVGGFLVKGSSGCVALWPHERYLTRLEQLEAKVEETDSEEDRNEERLFASAEYVTPDLQGRVPIAPYLQDFAGLRKEKVLVLGANRVVEIWDPERWAQRVEAPAEQRLLGAAAPAGAS